MAKWQTIGIKVPAGSDLPNRLKILSEKRYLSYQELLEIWVSQEEQEEHEIPEPTPREKFMELEERIAALEAAQKSKSNKSKRSVA